ncbi:MULTISPECIES: MFS transporter [Asaia]|uniref:MFS transporter n=1 Tax=Asaia TaxID=91914 RepID=UPI002FC3CDE0
MNRTTVQRLQNSTRAVFFLVGVVSALWSCLVPVVKQHAALNDGTLGLLLLCLGIGSIIGMPLAGQWVGRWGCRIVATGGLSFAGTLLMPLALLHDVPLLAASVFGLGMGLGAVETAMNIQAIDVEKQSGRPMLSGFHAFFSIGGAIGAAGPQVLALVQAQPWVSVLIGELGIIGLFGAAWRGLLNHAEPGGGAGFGLPRGIVWLLGLLTCIAFLAEGAVLDWGGVYLSGERVGFGITPGWGYAVFATAMTFGRLTGDHVVAKAGPALIMAGGSLCAALGFALVVYGPNAPLLLGGFVLIGLGCANIVPVLYAATGRQSVMKVNAAVAAITTMGYAGILAGPALVGAVAHVSSLSVAFLLLAALLVFIALNTRLAR